MCLLHFSVCLSIYLSVCLFVCLSKSIHVFVCMSVCFSLSLSLSQHMWCCPSRLGFSGSIPGISSLLLGLLNPFWINLSWWKPIIMVLNYASFIRNHYPSPMSKSGPDVFLIFQCSGICPTPAQGDILVSD